MNGSLHFKPHELACRCGCGTGEMDQGFLKTLEVIRIEYGKPMIISSAYRCADHNASVSSTGRDGVHTTGMAVDVLVSGQDAFNLVEIALQEGITGIGINQKGPHDQRFVHLDMSDRHTRPMIWSY